MSERKCSSLRSTCWKRNARSSAALAIGPSTSISSAISALKA